MSDIHVVVDSSYADSTLARMLGQEINRYGRLKDSHPDAIDSLFHPGLLFLQRRMGLAALFFRVRRLGFTNRELFGA